MLGLILLLAACADGKPDGYERTPTGRPGYETLDMTHVKKAVTAQTVVNNYTSAIANCETNSTACDSLKLQTWATDSSSRTPTGKPSVTDNENKIQLERASKAARNAYVLLSSNTTEFAELRSDVDNDAEFKNLLNAALRFYGFAEVAAIDDFQIGNAAFLAQLNDAEQRFNPQAENISAMKLRHGANSDIYFKIDPKTNKITVVGCSDCTFPTIDLTKFANGVLNDAHFKMEMGSRYNNLKYSEFGYWRGGGSVGTFAGGYDTKRVDMKDLTAKGNVTTKQEYIGKAYAALGDAPDSAGKIINGTARLTFDPTGDTPTEELEMAFYNWYEIKMNADKSLTFTGTPAEHAYANTGDITVQNSSITYYGDTAQAGATEAVGTLDLGANEMADGKTRTTDISFGVKKN